MNFVLGLAVAICVFLMANGLYKLIERRRIELSKSNGHLPISH